MQLDIVRQPLSLTLLLLALLLALFWGSGDAGPAGVRERQALPAAVMREAAGPADRAEGRAEKNGTGAGEDTATRAAARAMPLEALLAPGSVPPGFPYRLGTAALLFLAALLVTRIVTRNMVLVVRTYLPALFFAVVASGFYRPDNGAASAVAALLLIAGSDRLIAGFRRKASFDPLFRGAFLLGTAPLVAAPAVLFFPAVPVAVVLFRRNGHEAAVALIGYVLPLLVCSYVYWGMGYPFGHVGEMLAGALTTPAASDMLTLRAGLWRMALAALLLLLTALSIVSFAGHAAQMRTRARRIFLYFIYMLVPGAGLFLLPGRSPEMFALLAVPLAVIAPNFFVRHTGALPALLYLSLLLCAAAVRFLPSPF